MWGNDGKVSGPYRCVLLAQMWQRRNWLIVDGRCRPRKVFSCEFCFLIQAENPLSFRYFTLFLIYTPYTIYQCKLFFYDIPAIDILSLHQMDSRDGERLFSMMDWDVRRSSQNYWQSCNETSDIILGACDVEGNFLVVRVRGFIRNR